MTLGRDEVLMVACVAFFFSTISAQMLIQDGAKKAILKSNFDTFVAVLELVISAYFLSNSTIKK